MALPCCALLALATWVAVPTAMRAQQPEAGAALSGVVVDAGSGEGVEGVLVSLEGTRLTATTNRAGVFRFDGVPIGAQVIVTQRLGYQSRSDSVSIPFGASVRVSLAISVEPVPLQEIVVSLRSLLLETRGFYDRQAQGFRGTFLDRATIEDRDPLNVSDLFRLVQGVEVVNGSRLIMSRSVNFRDGGRGCEPSLWLDGIRSGLREYDYLRPDHIEGIEVYSGGGPGKFNDLCGTVVIWTRVPLRNR